MATGHRREVQQDKPCFLEDEQPHIVWPGFRKWTDIHLLFFLTLPDAALPSCIFLCEFLQDFLYSTLEPRVKCCRPAGKVSARRRNVSVGGSRAAKQHLRLQLKATLVLTHRVISAPILPGCLIKDKVKDTAWALNLWILTSGDFGFCFGV